MPLVSVALFLTAGIVLGRWMPFVSVPVWTILALTLLLVAWLSGRRPGVQTLLLLLASTLVGCLLVQVAGQSYRVNLPADRVSYEAVVVSQPVEQGRVVRFNMLIAKGPLTGQIVRVTLLRDTVSGRYRQLRPGSAFKACSRFERPRNSRHSHFDYVTYLQSQGIGVQTFIYHTQWRLARVSLSSLTRWQRTRIALQSLRVRVMERYRHFGLEGEAMAVVAAMTLGDKSAITAPLRSVYQHTGVSHVLALSGMHLSVFTMLVVGIYRRRLRLMRTTLFLVAVWVYVVMVGMMPSIVRAATMSSVWALLSLTRRPVLSLNVLAFTALLMLVVNPFSLYDVGFQLSFVSVAFILVYTPLLMGVLPRPLLQRHPLLRWLCQLVVLSLSAQLGTAPLVALYFGQLPLYFLLSNLLVVPVVALIVYLSLLLLLASAFPYVSLLLARLLTLVVTSLHTVLTHIASLPYASIPVSINAIQAFLFYIFILSLSVFFYILLRNSKN